jgi:Na+/melibiose symporter-like transporter
MAGFALPALPKNALVVAVFVFLPPLYAEYQGLGTAVVGGILLIVKIFDMVSTPIWGLVMDKYKTPWGRRRPWLVLSVPLLMVPIYMLFHPPESAGSAYLLGWLIIMYVGWDGWGISHTAWALELSRDYDLRSRITGLLQVMIMLGAILVSLVPAVMERVLTVSYEEKAAAISLFLIITLPISVIICLLSVPEREALAQPHLGFKKGLSIILANMALLRLLLANALLTFSTYFVQGLFVFFVSYTLGLGNWVGFILVFLVVGGLLFVPVWVKLSERWSKHRTVQAAVVVGALSPLLLLIVPPGSVVLTAAAFMIMGVNVSANEFLPRAMLADVCDHDNISGGGSERMGLYYALLQLSSKLASGTAVFIGFSFLPLFGFDPQLGLENTAEALQRLRYLIVTLPVIAYLIIVLLMSKYPITRERQHEMRRIIEAREREELGST